MSDSDHPLTSKLYRTGIRQEDAVAIQCENNPQFADLVLSCWQLGAVVIPISTRYPPAMVRSILDDFNVRAFFTSSDLKTAVAKAETFVVDDFVSGGGSDWSPVPFDKKKFDLQANASIILTSGSSVKPKAVLHTLGNHYFSALGAHDNIPFGPRDKWLASLPMYHISGFSLIMRIWLHGGTLVCPFPIQPLAESIKQHDMTHLSLVPTQLIQLLQDRACIQKLKGVTAILLGGAPLPLNLIQKAMALELPIYRTYGSTEMASQITTTRAIDCCNSNNSAGYPLNYRKVKLSPDGEIRVKGRVLFKGYVHENRVALPLDDDGFFATGDIGYFDDGNRLYLTGRKDLMFISGGENIHPEEIEQAIVQLESVEQAVVVPVEDARFGKRPVAFVKTKKGVEFDDARAKEVLQDRLESFKIPDDFLPWPWELGLSLKPSRSEFQACAAEYSQLKLPPEHS
ncbi:MAG: o-succinylbenzoate--CoA ligase [Planctomycetota bacterium]|jgi:O-succinylbenzoic acid--CoA ligase